MTAILAIETATEACSAALWVKGEITSVFEFAPQAHARLILPMIDHLLKSAGLRAPMLTAIAYGCGPGSFTGVRIAAAVTQGIAFAHDLPVIPVSTLQALAQEAYIKHSMTHVLAAMDARMKEIYWGAYILEEGIMGLSGKEVVISPSLVENPLLHDWFGAGSAWKSDVSHLYDKFSPLLKGCNSELFPTAYAVAFIAADLYRKGKIFSPEQAVPVYLRNQIVALPSIQQK